MTNIENQGKEGFISGLAQGAYNTASTLASTMEWIQVADENYGNDKNNEAARDNRLFSMNFDENLIRDRQFTVNTSFVQSNLTILENSMMPEPRVMLGFTSRANFIIGCLILFLMVAPCSLIGPMTINLPAQNVYVQASWRYQG